MFIAVRAPYVLIWRHTYAIKILTWGLVKRKIKLNIAKIAQSCNKRRLKPKQAMWLEKYLPIFNERLKSWKKLNHFPVKKSLCGDGVKTRSENSKDWKYQSLEGIWSLAAQICEETYA